MSSFLADVLSVLDVLPFSYFTVTNAISSYAERLIFSLDLLDVWWWWWWQTIWDERWYIYRL